MKAILITTLSDETLSLLASLCVPLEIEAKSFNDLIKLLDAHFTPVKSYISARYEFYRAEKNPMETAAEWAARVRTLSIPCGFGSELNIVLRDIFTLGLEKQFKERLFEEDATNKIVTMNKMMDIALAKEMAGKNAAKNNQESSEVNFIKGNKFTHMKSTKKITNKQYSKNSQKDQAGETHKQKCQVCGRQNHKSNDCKYKGYTCNLCHLVGHLAPMCKNKNKFNKKNKTYNTHYIENKYNSSDDDDIFLGVSDNFKLISEPNNETSEPLELNVQLNDINIKFQIDTGSLHSLVSESCYLENFSHIKLDENDIILKDYIGKHFKPLGKLNLNFECNSNKGQIALYVIKNGGPPLIGRNDFKKLNLSITQDVNYVHLSYTNNEPKDIKSLCQKYSKVFDKGLGTFSKYKITLFVNQNCTPKFFKPRFVPFALKTKVEIEINRLVKNGVLIPVEHSKWATPIVPVLKPDNTVRLCGDFSVTLNPVLQGTQYPLPKIDYLFAKHTNGIYFSKIDLKDAYAQLILSEESRNLVVINTHLGLYAYTRLPYGINCAASIFQRVLEQTIGDIDGVTVFQDDISISGKTRSEHNNRLENVLNKLQNSGLKVKVEKCKFLKNSIEYLGHILDGNGIHSTEKHIEAIKNVVVPNSLSELKSFLGMVTYYIKYIPNSAEFLEPLYKLTRKEEDFIWSNKCNNAFNQIKKFIAVGAILSHVYNDNTERPIAFASHLLTKAEQKYPQLEREGLAIIFGLKKFHDYLFGKHFTLVTDNKPIAHILNPNKGIPTIAANRLQRWAYILMSYKFNIKWVSTSNNPADYLSRLSKQSKQIDIEANTNYLNFINDESNWILDWFKIKKATRSDPIISKIVDHVSNDNWPNDSNKNSNILPYYKRKNELTIEQNVLMWGYRVIIPAKFRNKLLDQLHESHQGTTKMKNCDIEKLTSSCEVCCENRAVPPKAILKPFEWPTKPWTRIHIDFFGPIFGQVFFVLVDATSKWIECFKVNSLNTTTVLKHLTEVFSRFGLPKSITSDGAKCFSNDVFHSFLKMYGIMHLVGAPYHPQSNGAAESAVKIIKNFIKKIIKSPVKSDLDIELSKFLFQYRNTPHTTTKETPTKILLGKSVRFIFDLLKPQTDDIVLGKQITQIQNSGRRDAIFDLNEKVLIRDYRSPSSKWKTAIVTKILGTRNYHVTTDENHVWKRHVDQMLKIKKSNHEQISNANIDSNRNSIKSPFSETTLNTTNNHQRPKRTIRKPVKYYQ
ncbi:Uncharacterized protein FWK35_00035850, partial [Aphis craccivora]